MIQHNQNRWKRADSVWLSLSNTSSVSEVHVVFRSCLFVFVYFFLQQCHIFNALFLTVPPHSVYILEATSSVILSGDVLISGTSSTAFICLATDTAPPVEITWVLDGKSQTGEISVTGSRLFNTSSTITVAPLKTGQKKILTCKATGSGKSVSRTVRLVGLKSGN